MSQNQRPDPYASAAESAALLVLDTRTPAERTLETLLDNAYYNEQGAEPLHVMRRVALELVEKMEERVPLTDDQKDAARYRWLRATTSHVTSKGQKIDVRNQPDAWDKVIDAAIEAAQEVTKGST